VLLAVFDLLFQVFRREGPAWHKEEIDSEQIKKAGIVELAGISGSTPDLVALDIEKKN
jgi:hypothetical protein